MGVLRRRATIAATAAASVAALLVPAHAASATRCTDPGWTAYGRDSLHTFQVEPGCSHITASSAPTLVPKWFFHTGSAVTASPAVSNGTLYVGSWDGTFYALDATTGAERWRFVAPAPYPTAFGVIVSSATLVQARDAQTGRGRLVVLFGAANRLYALDARTGRKLASLDIDPRTAAVKRKQAANPPVVEIESSPVVGAVRVDGHREQLIYVGLDVHNDSGVGPAGVVAARLLSSKSGQWTLQPQWKSDPETGRTYTGRGALTAGSGTGFGCGDVWSSPALDARANLLVYGVGNCDHPQQARAAGHYWSEAIVAVRADTGTQVWRFTPESLLPQNAQLDAAYADSDFGASPNFFTTSHHGLLVGDGCKDGNYYAVSARTGRLVWHSAAAQPGYTQQNFAVGGFIGSSAVQTTAAGRAQRIIGASAIPVPHDPSELAKATWQVRSIDPDTGAIQWLSRVGGPSYAATSIVNGLAFVPDTTNSALYALDASTGQPVWAAPAVGPPSSTAVVDGDSVYLGTGTTESDLEYKSLGLALPQKTTTVVGQGPLDPVSGVQAWELAQP